MVACIKKKEAKETKAYFRFILNICKGILDEREQQQQQEKNGELDFCM